MTIAQIVLASLNIIVAIAMFYLAGQSAYARAAWSAQVRGLEKLRDGTQTGEWLKDLKANEHELLRSRIVVDEGTFMTLEPADRIAMIAKLRGSTEGDADVLKSEAGIRSEIAKLFWSTGERTIVKKAGDKEGDKKTYSVVVDEEAKKRTPASKLLNMDDPEVAAWAKKLGPAGFTKLLRAAIQQHYPQLDLDAREAAAKVYFARQRLALAKNDQAAIKVEVEELGKRRDVEKDLLRQAELENLERRREITRLEADVEEALSALTLALGREADRKRTYEDIKQKTNAAADVSDKLVNAIKNKEDK